MAAFKLKLPRGTVPVMEPVCAMLPCTQVHSSRGKDCFQETAGGQRNSAKVTKCCMHEAWRLAPHD
eukprot:5476294-Amphidinium_carterae.1